MNDKRSPSSSTNRYTSLSISDNENNELSDPAYGRVFQYEPVEKVKIDPMAYGAYRRSKLPPTPVETKDSKNNEVQSGRKNNNKSSKNKMSGDNFYDQV